MRDALGGKNLPAKDAQRVNMQEVKRIHARFAEHAEDALSTLMEIMQDDTAKQADRVSAAKAVLDRGLGTPVQTTQLNIENGNESGFDANKVSKLDSDQLAQIESMLMQIADTSTGDLVDVTSESQNESDDDAKGD